MSIRYDQKRFMKSSDATSGSTHVFPFAFSSEDEDTVQRSRHFEIEVYCFVWRSARHYVTLGLPKTRSMFNC